jgi:cobalt-zinc-cadmium efflux system outer membrane protein
MQLRLLPCARYAAPLLLFLLVNPGVAGAAELAAAASTPRSQQTALLPELVAEALAANPGVLAAAAALDAARARERAADKPLYNPELEVDGEDAETRTAFLGVRQTFDWADKQGARTRVAAYQRSAAEADLAQSRQSLAVELLAAVGGVRTAHDLLRLAEERSRLMQRFADLAERRREAGDLGRVDLDLARLAASQADLERALSTAEFADSRRALAAILGEPLRLMPDMPTELPDIEFDGLNVEALIAALPSVRARRARVEAARSLVNLRARERQADPTIMLRGGAEDSSETTDSLIGITLSIPLFVRNPFRAEVEAAGADLSAAEKDAENARRRARAQLLASAERYRSTHRAWRDWQHTGRPSLASQVDLLQRIWQAGEMSTTDYLVQLRQTLDTEAGALELRGRFWRAWFDWLGASGQVGAWLGLAGAS